MVFELQFRNRLRLPALSAAALLALLLAGASVPARADESAARHYLGQARQYFEDGQYFRAARYAFAANEEDPSVRAEAYSWITLGLAHARLYNTAVYFFIRTLQTDDKAAIRRILPETPEFLVRLGPDLLRSYLIRHTGYEDYDAESRSAYLFALAKEALLIGDPRRAIGYLNAVRSDSGLYPFALQLRGVADALLDSADGNSAALADFRLCEKTSDRIPASVESGSRYREQAVREAEDLKARCYADEARTLYQMDRFEEADWTYDRIPKSSLVWPGILFEQAWNSFAKGEYNRALGKLVSYKSPALTFIFNTEIDVLRAQSYLGLCLYQDANATINEFNSRYVKTGEEVKRFVESNQRNLPLFYETGKRALHGSLYATDGLYQMANQFVRGPYFQNLVFSEEETGKERLAIAQFAAIEDMNLRGMRKNGGGFPAFLDQVLGWRLKTIHLLGGIFVKNSFLDYHSALIGDFEKMAFIKLEMLKRAKDQLLHAPTVASGDERSRGNVIPARRDDQMYWSFNGEFWDDELGDYVFGLESECKENGS